MDDSSYTYEPKDTWQHIARANELVLSRLQEDPHGQTERNDETERQEEFDEEFARITARLRFLNMIELALSRRGEKKD